MDPFYFGPDQQLDAAAAAVVDEDYYLQASLGLVLSPPAPPPPAALSLPGSAFEAYHQQRRVPALLEHYSLTMSARGRRYSGEQNLHRRMFSYLRRVVAHGHGAAAASTGGADVVPPAFPAPADETTTTGGVGPSSQAPRSSRFRHIMRERLRRERLSQGFADLHALLPLGASSKVSHHNDTHTHTNVVTSAFRRLVSSALPARHACLLPESKQNNLSMAVVRTHARRVARTTSSARRRATSGSWGPGRSGSAPGTRCSYRGRRPRPAGGEAVERGRVVSSAAAGAWW